MLANARRFHVSAKKNLECFHRLITVAVVNGLMSAGANITIASGLDPMFGNSSYLLVSNLQQSKGEPYMFHRLIIVVVHEPMLVEANAEHTSNSSGTWFDKLVWALQFHVA